MFTGARGANLWLRNSKGDLPLHEAVASGRRELVKWLLDGRPSQVNATNHEGRTPLHIAAATDNADLCRLLLDRGAEVNPVARSSKNEPLTPLDCAASRGHRSTAKYLQMHGGLPASKLSNTQIVIDGAQVTGLPTRKVTSTKIDVRDRIKIEKREVVELSSPISDRHRLIKQKSELGSLSSSSEGRKPRKKSQNGYSDRYPDRRKGLAEKQKSFSDGYDSEFEGYEKRKDYKHKAKKDVKEKKNRSRSEPRGRIKESAKHRRHCRSTSESSSDSSDHSRRRKSKRHRKRHKRKSSSTSMSSSESSERRTTKRRGKKTSIHIEHDDEKQKVNIVKYKKVETPQQSSEAAEHDKDIAKADEIPVTTDIEPIKEQFSKTKTHSETETDTLSVKTNMVITEAQIHMERESSQHGSSELTVTMDSSNNVSIEATNLSVTHKEGSENLTKEEDKLKEEEKEAQSSLTKEETETKSQDSPPETTATEKVLETQNIEMTEESASKSIDDLEQTKHETGLEPENEKRESIEDTEKEIKSSDKESESVVKVTPEESTESAKEGSIDKTRKTSFKVLSGPDEIKSSIGSQDNKTSFESTTKEFVESQDKIPAVSFSDKDEVFKIKDTDSAEHLMGEQIDHKQIGEMEDIKKETSLADSKGSLESTEQENIEATTGSVEDTPPVDKGIIKILDDGTSTDIAQQSFEQDDQESFDTSLPLTQASPRRLRSSKDSQGSSRKSSIYETESYKVLSDTVGIADVGTAGILKKPSVGDDEQDPNCDQSLRRDSSFGRIPSISDNEIYYSHSEANGRRKRFRKKGRMKSRLTIRSKSENSERGYESSGLMDSGFEPSPRPVQRCIMSPRLNAYYQQRKSARVTGISDSKIPVRKPGDKKAVDMRSVTQRIQTNMRRYTYLKHFNYLLRLRFCYLFVPFSDITASEKFSSIYWNLSDYK